MRLVEASSHFGISEQKLRNYEIHGLLHCHEEDGDMEYSEKELEQLFKFHFLVEAGMDIDSMKQLMFLQQRDDSQEKQIRVLRKFRFEMLDDIHKKQQCLDSVDFLIRQISQEGGKGK